MSNHRASEIHEVQILPHAPKGCTRCIGCQVVIALPLSTCYPCRSSAATTVSATK